MRSYDAISMYTMMNENFKGGVNNVMLRNKDPVDSRYHQRCVDNKHEMGTHASVNNKPIRVKGRFACLFSPVRDADWSDVRSVDLSPVGDVWIEYIGDEFYQSQSTDAAPLNYKISTRFSISTVIVLQDLLRFGLSVLRFRILFVVKNLHGVVVICQCVKQWMVRR